MDRRVTFVLLAVLALCAACVAPATSIAADQASAAQADAVSKRIDKALQDGLDAARFDIPTMEVVVGVPKDALPAGTTVGAGYVAFVSAGYAPPVARTAQAGKRQRKPFGAAQAQAADGADTILRFKLIEEGNTALQRGRKVVGTLVLTASYNGTAREKKTTLSISPVRGPACFGAASRDPERKCHNPELETQTIPSPEEALLLPNAFCDLVTDRAPNTCSFGLSPFTKSAPRIALLGDSHATHWRGALETVAQREGWRAYSITRSGCPMSRAIRKLPAGERESCRKWNNAVIGWFKRHPEVSTIFVSHNAKAEVMPPDGRSQAEYRRWGFHQIWRDLPDTVKHVVVIRDPFSESTQTQACVARVAREKGNAGERCKVRRSERLRGDPTVEAAKRMSGDLVDVIDLSRYFCDNTYCYPVIGGALVHKDGHHITEVYATTLGPVLAKYVNRLQKGW